MKPTKPTDLVLKMLEQQPRGKKGTLRHIAKATIAQKQTILEQTKKHPTPFYLLDHAELKKSADTFKEAFDAYLPGHQPYFAIKSNYHRHILKTAVEQGYGLDASSEREFMLALEAKPKKIIFTGPGKSDRELELALRYAKITTINIDSFTELKRLGTLAKKQKTAIRAGIRFFSSHHGTWSKFGIPLDELAKFWEEAKKYPYIQLEGLHFHISLNLHAEKYIDVLRDLSTYLAKKFPKKYLNEIKFIDIGGGYYPDNTEGFYPWSDHYPWTLSGGNFTKKAHDFFGEHITFPDKYYITRADSPKQLAQKIGTFIKKHFTMINAEYYTEPGRILCNSSTSIVTKIADIKDDVIILDGGINMSGWEFGQHFYFPIINLSHPSLTEKHFKIYGPLCTPRDFWGYYMYSEKPKTGDLIVIPSQGAYKFTLAQEFIRPIPPTYIIR